MSTLLNIQTAWRNHKTILLKSFATSPFKIANITENKNERLLDLMLMSSSPGILSGDEHQLHITVEANCSLRLHTQSFQRLFTMQQGVTATGAIQTFRVEVKEDALFCYIPHPTVPHKNSIFSSFNTIKLHPASSLIWGEIISCGRKLNGEAFYFTRLRIKTEIFVADKLVIKENFLAEPAKTNLSSLGQWEGYSHQASLIIVNESMDLNKMKVYINQILQKQTGIEYGISEPQLNGLVIRLLGYKGEQLYKCLQEVAFGVNRLFEKKIQPYVA
ncbi:MAG: urease accessory protein UreD [Chitinophagaceae bacterium]|nr:urease accessory protein UreD [Chitinophagaceae bacterium]